MKIRQPRMVALKRTTISAILVVGLVSGAVGLLPVDRAFAAPGTSTVSQVEFMTFEGKDVLKATGNDFYQADASNPYVLEGLITQKSMVTLNGQALPFCTAGLGVTADIFIDSIGVAPELVSDNPSCYLIASESPAPGSEAYIFTPDELYVWLAGNFDSAAVGTISVNGSPDFTFNQQNGSPVEPVVTPVLTAEVASGNAPSVPATGYGQANDNKRSTWPVIAAITLVGLGFGLLANRRRQSKITSTRL